MLLKALSYYQTGGSCDQLHSPASVQELAELMAELHQRKTPYFLLGAGSNSLVMDEHWPGAVILFNKLTAITIAGTAVTVEAGLKNTTFAEKCHNASLAGASWMNYLPGQIGSTVRMNARCYGGEISQIVESVTVVNQKGEIKSLTNHNIFYGYKNTRFMTSGEVIAAVAFKLKEGDPQEIKTHMSYCQEDREQKHQFLFPSCGCVFKNNYTVGLPSGLLLDKADVRQLNTNQVQISPYHANFVFNKGGSALDILETTLNMQELVYEKFGVWLEYELEILGRVPEKFRQRITQIKKQAFKESQLAKLRDLFPTPTPL